MRWDSERELSLRRHCTRTKNTIDSWINSTTDHFLQRRFIKFSDITQCNGHYAVQGHSTSYKVTDFGTNRKLIYDFLLVITSYLASFPRYGWLLVKLSLARAECLTLSLSLGVTPAQYAINDISLKTRFCGLHFRCSKYWCIFNHFYVIRPESYRIRWNYAHDMDVTPFKVIQGHRVWYQSKAHMRLPISD